MKRPRGHIGCIFCHGRPRRVGIGKGLYCPTCEALMEELVMEPALPDTQERRDWQRDATTLARHYARLAGMDEPSPPRQYRRGSYGQ